MSKDGGYIALKGFCYQFDKTILELFSRSSDVQVEQLQDLGFDDYLIQVKHHDTEYSSGQQKAKMKKPILQLLNQFQDDSSKSYVLYIYLKGVNPSTDTLDIIQLDEILGSEANSFQKKTRDAFVKSFTLVHAVDFYAQHREVIQKIATSYGKETEEAEIYYTMISSYLLQLVIEHPSPHLANRKTNRKEIDALINNRKQIIFRSNYAEMLGVDKYNARLRKIYFKTGLNREAYERFFILEICGKDKLTDVKELVLYIKSRWSKNNSKSIPDNDRFAPYIFMRNIEEAALLTLKKQLRNEGFKIKDGHDYRGAEFSVQSIMEKPTFSNQVFFRLINDETSLQEIISKPSRTKEVYQFYVNAPLFISDTHSKHVQIQVSDITQVKNIV